VIDDQLETLVQRATRISTGQPSFPNGRNSQFDK
jgi:hypothetical protein